MLNKIKEDIRDYLIPRVIAKLSDENKKLFNDFDCKEKIYW
ncbi:MAG: hypothetical protein R2771_14970 [Saprospiraceae bacterium]